MFDISQLPTIVYGGRNVRYTEKVHWFGKRITVLFGDDSFIKKCFFFFIQRTLRKLKTILKLLTQFSILSVFL